jgi:curved DNA-binding protein CbpA
VIDVLRAKPQPLGELLGRGLGSEQEVKRLVYGLLITRQVDSGIPGVEPVGVAEQPSSSRMSVAQRYEPPVEARPSPRPERSPAPAPVSPKPPAVETPELAELRQELERLAKNEHLNHYEVLGVTPRVSTEAVQNAFFALAKKWHPDRLAPEFASLRELVTHVFARMTEANQTLTDPARRREYDEQLKHLPTADEVEQVQRVLRATTAYQKAEVLLKRNNLAAAEAEAKLAVDNDPTQADHIALYAWIQSLKPNPNFDDFLKTLDKAVHMEPNNLRVRWYRGQLLKRMDRGARAVQDFRFIVEKDPRHLDAKREVRLYEMRRSNPSHNPGKRPSDPTPKPSKPPDGGGLFGKFFKKS